MSDQPTNPLWKPVAGAVAIALVILILFVLPAEYGRDLTGLGRVLGLTELANPAPRALAAREEQFTSDRISFTLEPFESLEYKYVLVEGAGLVFSWQADAPVEFDFHGEADGAEEGFAESFDAGSSARKSGTYVAPFDGEQGWFWENRGARAVTLTLETSGFIDEAVEYRDGFVNRRPVGSE